MIDFVKSCIDILLHIISTWGYPGIIVLMALESSLLPVPSEVVMIPAGYLAAQGKMDLTILVLCGTIGSIIGAWLNYFIALYLGRPIFVKYGKYVGMSEHHLEKVETFFYRHGEISTFVGRLLPVIRHLGTIPAGFAKMSLWKLTLYTALGAALWSMVLIAIGYFAGANPEMQHDLLARSSTYVIIGLLLMVVGYIIYQKKTASRTHRISVSKEYMKHIQGEKHIALVTDHEKIGRKDILCLISEGKEQEFFLIKMLKASSKEHMEQVLHKESIAEGLIQVIKNDLEKDDMGKRFFLHANIYLLKPFLKEK